MNTKEKIELIETAELRDKLADAIAEDIFNIYGLNDLFLETWLADNIRKQTLADIILGEQKVYVITLAKKVATDICYNEQVDDVGLFNTALDRYGELGVFVHNAIADFDLSYFEFVDGSIKESKEIDYADTIIIDDCAYVFDNDTEKKVCYKATIRTKHRTNYGLGFFRKRVQNRMAHHWKNCEVKLIETFEENGRFIANVTFLTKEDMETALANLNFRFGEKSGRPWKNSFVENISIVTPIG